MNALLKLSKRLTSALEEWPVRRNRKIEGFLSSLEAACLYGLARSLPPQSTCCEIGVWKGRSAYCIAKGLRNGRLYAVDSFDAAGEAPSAAIYHSSTGSRPLIEQFRDNMQSAGVLDKIEVVQGRSENVVEAVPDGLDLLFIDADHSIEGCVADYSNYFGKLKVDGYLIFHDYDSTRKDLGPTHVIETIVLPSRQVDFVRTVDRLWIGRRAR